VAGYAKGGAMGRLMEDPAGNLFTYEARADVGGRLAQFRGSLIDDSALGEFFERFGGACHRLR
jgi:hypothetical protein